MSVKDVGDASRVGAIWRPQNPPETMIAAAREAESAGLQELWIWEDCFFESGLGAAAAMLGATNRVTVGVGLIPVPLRNVAIVAMELATLQRMFPGRLRVAVGHGVQSWMAQVGSRASSPLGLMREYLTALRALLAGQRVSFQGVYVALDDVALQWPPTQPLPILMGAIGPKSLELAGECADGVLLDADLTVDEARDSLVTCLRARESAGITSPFVSAMYQRYYRGPDAAAQLDREAKGEGARAGLLGQKAEVSARVRDLHAAGIGTVIFMPSATDPHPAEYLTHVVTSMRASPAQRGSEGSTMRARS